MRSEQTDKENDRWELSKISRLACREGERSGLHSGASYRWIYENAAEEMDRLLGITHTALRSVQCRKGVCKELKVPAADSRHAV